MTTWRKEIELAQKWAAISEEIIHCTLSEAELDKEFNGDFGSTEGKFFTAWGEKYVYFPVCYDGAESVGFAPRNPCDEKMEHQGGG